MNQVRTGIVFFHIFHFTSKVKNVEKQLPTSKCHRTRQYRLVTIPHNHYAESHYAESYLTEYFYPNTLTESLSPISKPNPAAQGLITPNPH